MKLLRETTKWKNPTPNHIYIFDSTDTKIVGYIKVGADVAIKLSKPMWFSKKGRTFQSVPAKGFNLSAMV
jgi:hypothetical protein